MLGHLSIYSLLVSFMYVTFILIAQLRSLLYVLIYVRNASFLCLEVTNVWLATWSTVRMCLHFLIVVAETE